MVGRPVPEFPSAHLAQLPHVLAILGHRRLEPLTQPDRRRPAGLGELADVEQFLRGVPSGLEVSHRVSPSKPTTSATSTATSAIVASLRDVDVLRAVIVVERSQVVAG